MRVSSWGGLKPARSRLVSARDWRPGGGAGPILPFGNGRSYGDSCLIDDGVLLNSRALDRIESFDAATGLLVAEPGVLLSDVLARIVPLGWFLPVTPGTRFVTLGGALANDVHGKNHHRLGSFGRHVPWFELLRSDGVLRRCTADENAALYAATIGGMGLTGLVTRLAVQMIPIAGPLMRQDRLPFASLSGFFELAAASDDSHAYTVAWIDSLASGASLGRGVFFRANHSTTPAPAPSLTPPWPLLPLTPPLALINRLTLRGFNATYRAAQARAVHNADVGYLPFFYPLDRVGGWNRAYGPKGLRQFQAVVPRAVAPEAVADLLKAAGRAGEASFLTVLKMFGDVPSPGLMSFPMAGATLTLDFPYRGARTDALLATLDRITLAAGGRVNPYKDARMPAAVFQRSFPRWREFARHIDPAFNSNFWRRVSVG